MGLTKTQEYSTEQNVTAVIAKAIGHPARIAILQHLANTNTCVCGDIVEVLPLSQSTVSQHLKALKEAGLIHGNISGPSVCYCIHAENWEKAKKLINTLFDSFDPKKSCC